MGAASATEYGIADAVRGGQWRPLLNHRQQHDKGQQRAN